MNRREFRIMSLKGKGKKTPKKATNLPSESESMWSQENNVVHVGKKFSVVLEQLAIFLDEEDSTNFVAV